MEYLGKGGFGKVVKAIGKESRDPIAIKFLKFQSLKDHDAFMNEKKIMIKLKETNCQNIVKYIDGDYKKDEEFEVTDKHTSITEIKHYQALALLMECGECNLLEIMKYR